ncbi:MAG: MlaD family protein [Pseudomonadales bacterium]
MKSSAYTPFEVGAKDRIVGFFVIGAVLLFLIGFLIPIVQRFQADEGIPFYTLLDQTYGIAPNATVTLRGVLIGNVTDVAITDDGTVRVDISLSNEYANYYTYRSKLLVDTELGVSTILTGSGLILHPGSADNDILEPGALIPSEKPGGISSLMQQLDLPTLTQQVTRIVANVEEITSGVNENQQTLYRSLENLEVMTASLAEVTSSLPKMVLSVDESLAALRVSLENIDGLVSNTDENLQLTLQNTAGLTEQATRTLAEAEILFQTSEPVLRQLPTVMVTTDIALQSITDLTNQLTRSWLFGGNGEKPGALVPTGPSPHPHDEAIYNNNRNN